ncbi:MAG: beta-ketoacyl-[acyl-carrier-protein] synthase FabY [Pseudohongiella sp.]|nr:MAG: beta-ketoacyl-[acyl-carrier-protein] synthase FabY [Pseudohongiella sp.]
MNRLPVMVGFGGINPAGRASFDHSYRRLVISALDGAKQERTFRSLAQLMQLDASNLDQQARQAILDGTLIRRIENFDPNSVYMQSKAKLCSADGGAFEFSLARKQLPNQIPDDWQIEDDGGDLLRVKIQESLSVFMPDLRQSRVSSAGQLPTGFDPGALYPSRNHPRGLELAVYGASDAIRSTGFSIEQLKSMIEPDQMAVYSGSAIGQLDADGTGGLLQNSLQGRRPTSKNLALGLAEMPGDFVNAYVLGSVGETAGIIGACSTFLYSVKRGIDDIRSGSKRIVIVGNSEAPILPEIIEGFRTMGALAEDEALMALDNSDVCDHRRACRPFSSNSGFAISESSIWLVLMDDELAMEQGARILGSVGDVFVNADGYKKSIPGPGIGNYVTCAKAMASARAILGEEGLRRGSYMQAHGTGTPQNRVTESQIFNDLAKTFGIESWLVGAMKCYVGHSMAPAGGDQLSAILGAWNDGLVPGITTIDHIADDVHRSNLDFPLEHREIDVDNTPGAFLNSKGFGGNNATGFFISPQKTLAMLTTRYGMKDTSAYLNKSEEVAARAAEYDLRADDGSIAPIYKFGEGVVAAEDLSLNEGSIGIPGFSNAVNLDISNPYGDMTD